MMLPTTGAFLAAGAVAVAADQASKALAGRLLADGRCRLIAWRSGFRWVLNSRGALVLVSLRWAIIVWIAALIGAGLLAVEATASLGIGGAVGLGLALGGAASNLADRVLRGGVVDFIAVGVWPTFNLADVALVAGTALLAGKLV